MRWFILLSFLSPFVTKAQTAYIAAYEQQVKFDFSGVKLKNKLTLTLPGVSRKDSVNNNLADSVLRRLNEGGGLAQLLKEKFGESITVYTHVRADSVSAELESYSGSGMSVSARRRYTNGTWQTYNKETETYETDSTQTGDRCTFTGNTKSILGYTCFEARAVNSAKPLAVWVCRELPATLTPGISISGASGAILEVQYGENGSVTMLKSLQKVK